MKIYKEKAGVISEKPIWMCWHRCWLYTADSFLSLIIILITEWKHDRHLVG